MSVASAGSVASNPDAKTSLVSDTSAVDSTPIRVLESSMEQHRNERAWETGYPLENPPASGIVQQDSHMRKSGNPAAVCSAAQVRPEQTRAARAPCLHLPARPRLPPRVTAERAAANQDEADSVAARRRQPATEKNKNKYHRLVLKQLVQLVAAQRIASKYCRTSSRWQITWMGPPSCMRSSSRKRLIKKPSCVCEGGLLANGIQIRYASSHSGAFPKARLHQCFARRGYERVVSRVSVVPSAPTLLGLVGGRSALPASGSPFTKQTSALSLGRLAMFSWSMPGCCAIFLSHSYYCPYRAANSSTRGVCSAKVVHKLSGSLLRSGPKPSSFPSLHECNYQALEIFKRLLWWSGNCGVVLNFEVLRADEGEARRVWSCVGMERRRKREITEKTRLPVESSGTILSCQSLDPNPFFLGGSRVVLSTTSQRALDVCNCRTNNRPVRKLAPNPVAPSLISNWLHGEAAANEQKTEDLKYIGLWSLAYGSFKTRYLPAPGYCDSSLRWDPTRKVSGNTVLVAGCMPFSEAGGVIHSSGRDSNQRQLRRRCAAPRGGGGGCPWARCVSGCEGGRRWEGGLCGSVGTRVEQRSKVTSASPPPPFPVCITHVCSSRQYRPRAHTSAHPTRTHGSTIARRCYLAELERDTTHRHQLWIETCKNRLRANKRALRNCVVQSRAIQTERVSLHIYAAANGETTLVRVYTALLQYYIHTTAVVPPLAASAISACDCTSQDSVTPTLNLRDSLALDDSETIADLQGNKLDSTVVCENMPILTAHWLSAATVEGDDWASVLQEVLNTLWTSGLSDLNTSILNSSLSQNESANFSGL
ncbi:hypothetical protein PR048_022842 [Dryococelus australis]|uniref:Uncharacterized protein n=1 Tax=Dryococelus australis TaxID=614101 RepID=A0ABQ9GSD3_9NEOP|nr:hypothetical protein PR048_022842 [Dryococelus australis]